MLPLLLQRIPAALAHPHMAVAVILMSYAYRPVTGVAHQHHIADGDGALLLGDAALNILLRVRSHVLLHHHHVLYQDLALVGHHAEHPALLALISSGNHPHLIVAANVYTLLHGCSILWAIQAWPLALSIWHLAKSLSC